MSDAALPTDFARSFLQWTPAPAAAQAKAPRTAGAESEPNAGAGGAASQEPAKALDAARQFEALLLEQILRSERESGTGWLGPGGDSAGDCATDFAEQQLAVVLAKGGGIGLAKMIAAGLEESQARAGA